ncbi:hypothetical protein AB0J55_42755 [Amycolatopsis sp. NPDC049688]|uniref:hypothetical protein n=1 Tax=Amycolatopsis sp. NPDC049688 TaxID=3154733 RepID=UPI0034491D00
MSHEFLGRANAPAHPGRHRRGGAESWTPPLPQHRPVRHHAAGRVTDPPAVLPPQAGYGHGGGVGSSPEDCPVRNSGDAVGAYPAMAEWPAQQYATRYPGDPMPTDPVLAGSLSPHQPTRHPGDPLAADRATTGWPAQPYAAQHPADPVSSGSLPLNPPWQRHTDGPADPVSSGSLPLNHPWQRHTDGPADPVSSGSLPLNHPWQRHTDGPADPVSSGSLPLNHPWQRHTDRPADGRAPADPVMSGCLPLPSLPQPRGGRPAPLFPAVHGSLPLEAFEDYEAEDYEDFEDDPAGPSPAESRADQAARRTRVSLASPAPRGVDVDEDDARIYSAPPIDGLGGFTIGSVPASVTPPKTWRKAAWFATGASGAVVVGLLCAGSFLVGKPPVDQAVQGAWPGYQGAPAVVDPTSGQRPPTEGGSAAGPESAAPSETTPGKTSGGGAGPVDGVAPPPAGSTEAPATPTTGAATPDRTPRKPPVTPAQRETPVKSPWWYSFPPDAQTMGDNSEKFFNTVTTDPAAASSVTTGELHDQGPQALARRYAGIAYFEVKKVSIDQQRGVTVNTVEITHTDGTKTVEERTLTFGDGDKITADGQ